MNTEKKLNWALLTTGWGRNARTLIKDYAGGKLKNSRIALLICIDPDSGAARAAQKYGVEMICVRKNDFATVEEYQLHLIEEMKKRNIDGIFLLSYGYIIREPMLHAFPQRIVNIHPSLLPSFGKTSKAIQQALAYGVKITGITTHIIDEKVDEGVILCQEAIKIKDNDTFDTLDKKFQKKGRKIILNTIKQMERQLKNTN